MLELRDVSRTTGGVQFSGLTLDIAAGRPTAIVGLSAPEREAMARLISGVDRPQSGTIRLSGRDVAQARKEKGRIVRVEAQGLLVSGQRVGKLVSAETARRAGVTGQLETKISSLSADHRMRLALAQAAAARPSLLIVDAPASRVEPAARDALTAHLGELLGGANGVVVILAADADEALELQGDIVVIDGGRVAQQGAAQDVCAHPVNMTAAAATSWPMLNTLPLQVREGRCILPDGSRLQLPEELPQPADGVCTLAFHPEDITLERASPGCVRFVVRARREELRGSRRYLDVSFAGATWLCPLAMDAPPAGAVLNGFVDRSRLILFDTNGRALN